MNDQEKVKDFLEVWEIIKTRNQAHCRLVGHEWEHSNDYLGHPQRYCFRCGKRQSLNIYKTYLGKDQHWENCYE